MARCVSCKSEEGFWQDGDRNPACQECRDAEKHRYYLINRPPGYATIPDGWFRYEVWMPSRNVTMGDGRTWNYLGWVEYPRQLSFHEILKWELVPAGDDH